MNDVIHRELPFLRRFARALAGRQSIGDQLVAIAMRAAAPELASLRASPVNDNSEAGAGKTSIPAPASLAASEAGRIRLLLFRALIDAHAGTYAATEEQMLTDERIVASRVRSLPPASATALLLSSLERFSV